MGNNTHPYLTNLFARHQAEGKTEQKLADEKARADAEMAYTFANLEMPRDLRNRARAWKMEALMEAVWNSGFQAGWKERGRSRSDTAEGDG